MNAVIGGISIFIEDDTQRFSNSLRNSAALVETQTNRMTRTLRGTASSIDDLNRKASLLRFDTFRQLANNALSAQTSIERLRSTMLAVVALGGGFTGAFAAKALADTADQYTNLQNKIAVVVADTRQRAIAEELIFQTAQRTRSSLESTATLYQRLTIAATNLGATQTDVLRVVESTQKAMQLGGATTQEASAAAVQLAQALGSGRLQGDELRSILENAPVLAQALAKHFGVAVGDLKEMGSEGKLLAKDVFRGILAGSTAIDESFSSLRPTIQSSIVVLDNAFTRYIGKLDQTVGASAAIAQTIVSLSNNFQAFGDSILYAGGALAALFASRIAGRAIGSPIAVVRSEMKDRAEAVAKAQETQTSAIGRVVDVAAQKDAVQRRARQDLTSFADKGVLFDRDRVAKALEADLKLLADAEKRYQDALGGFAKVDQAAAAKSAEKLARGADMKPLRDRLGAAVREVKNAEAEIARLAEQSPAARFERRLETLAKREEALRTQRPGALRNMISNMPSDTTAVEDLDKVKGRTALVRIDEQLAKIGKQRAEIAEKIAVAERSIAEASTAASARSEAGKRGIINAEKELATAVNRRAAAEFGAANNAQMGAVAAANASRQAAKANVDLTRDILKLSNEEVARNATTNANRAIGAFAIPTAHAAHHYKEAVDGVAAATQRASAAQVALATATRLAGTAFSSVLGFLGGPLGAALFGATAGFALYEISQAKAAQRAEEFKTAVDGATAAVKRLEEAQTSQARGQALADVNTTRGTLGRGIEEAKRDLFGQTVGTISDGAGSFRDIIVDSKLEDTIRALQGKVGASDFAGLDQGAAKLLDLAAQGKDTKGAMEALLAELTRLSGTSIDVAGITGPLRTLLSEITKATAAANTMSAAVSAASAAGNRKNVYDTTSAAQDAVTDASIDRQMAAQRARTDELGSADAAINAATKRIAQDKQLSDKITDATVKNTRDRNLAEKRAREQIDEKYPDADPALRAKLAKLEADNLSDKKAGAKSEDEKFEDRLKRITEEGRAGFFTDIDRALIEELKKIKGEPKLMKDTVDAIKAGRPLPEQSQRLRDALVLKEGGKEFRDLVEKYGSMEQILPMVNERQRTLNMLVQEGKISADQAAQAFADYSAKFQSLKWVDTAADSFKSFGSTLSEALYDGTLSFQTLTDAANSFGKALFQIGINEALLQPLRNMLRAGMSAGATGGNPLSAILSAFGGGDGLGGTNDVNTVWHHAGGVVTGAGSRPMPWSLFANAPRLHSGTLRPDEQAAILQKGEEVLTKNQRRSIAGTMASLADMKGGGGRGDMVVNVQPASGTEAQVQTRRNSTGMTADVVIRHTVGQDLATGGELAQMLEGRYGLNPMRGRRS